MKVSCLMMQKNERSLLEPWILYHGAMFGFENLYVYDNGSTNQECVDLLKKYQELGLNVEWSFDTKQHFEHKGYIIAERIKDLDRLNASDFYFPLDCDEFIVAERDDGSAAFDVCSILNELSSHYDAKHPLAISAAYDNNPLSKDFYYKSEGQRKTFFTRNTCKTLDLGFHAGTTHESSEPIKTAISYVHYHYKLYVEYIESAKQKLIGRIDDFSKESLMAFAAQKKPGFHLVGTLLSDEDEYYRSMYRKFSSQSAQHISLKGFSEYIGKLGLNCTLSQDLHDAFKNNVPRIRGYVDFVRKTETGISLHGWFANAYERELDQVKLFIDERFIVSASVARHVRKDVKKIVPYAENSCGFVAQFDITEAESFSDGFTVYGVVSGKDVRLSVSPNVLTKFTENEE